jgi:hypothetical protein
MVANTRNWELEAQRRPPPRPHTPLPPAEVEWTTGTAVAHGGTKVSSKL